MDELEQRLSSALTEMAEEVPPSLTALAEHQRRVARKSRRSQRRPAILAAAAAVAVALILVPFLITSGRGGPPELNVAQPPARSSTPQLETSQPPNGLPVYQPKSGEVVRTQPVSLLEERVGNDRVVTYVYTLQRSDGLKVCTAQQPLSAGLVINGTSAQCSPMSSPGSSRLLLAKVSVPTVDTPGVYVYVLAKPVERLYVRQAEGSPLVAGSTRVLSDQFTVFLVTLGSTVPPIKYSALGPSPAYQPLENG